MRIVSLVPSWTETLLEAGVNVVGRTRFCIHPAERVRAIPAVAGTKDWNWPRIQELQPDFLLLDREENPKFMSEQKDVPWVATHVRSVADMPQEMTRLAETFQSDPLREQARRWREVLARIAIRPWDQLPGVVEWWRKPECEIENVIYVIWKKPWMAAGPDTFIGSMLASLGEKNSLCAFDTKYPELNEEALRKPGTLLLFSTEPYPFRKEKQRILEQFSGASALVDGESFSWFGVRALQFLEREFVVR